LKFPEPVIAGALPQAEDEFVLGDRDRKTREPCVDERAALAMEVLHREWLADRLLARRIQTDGPNA
jgi:hypothetical protein